MHNSIIENFSWLGLLIQRRFMWMYFIWWSSPGVVLHLSAEWVFHSWIFSAMLHDDGASVKTFSRERWESHSVSLSKITGLPTPCRCANQAPPTHTNTHTQSNSLTPTHTHTYTESNSLTRTQTHTESNSHAHTHTHTHTQSNTHIHAHRATHSYAHTHSHTHRSTHSLAHTHTHTDKLSLTHTHS